MSKMRKSHTGSKKTQRGRPPRDRAPRAIRELVQEVGGSVLKASRLMGSHHSNIYRALQDDITTELQERRAQQALQRLQLSAAPQPTPRPSLFQRLMSWTGIKRLR